MSKAQQIRDLEAKLLELESNHATQVEELQHEVALEQVKRVAAQRGLTPYVYAIQALNAWLTQHPDLLQALAPTLQELGLFGVRVAYDPERESALSVIGANRA